MAALEAVIAGLKNLYAGKPFMGGIESTASAAVMYFQNVVRGHQFGSVINTLEDHQFTTHIGASRTAADTCARCINDSGHGLISAQVVEGELQEPSHGQKRKKSPYQIWVTIDQPAQAKQKLGSIDHHEDLEAEFEANLELTVAAICLELQKYYKDIPWPGDRGNTAEQVVIQLVFLLRQKLDHIDISTRDNNWEVTNHPMPSEQSAYFCAQNINRLGKSIITAAVISGQEREQSPFVIRVSVIRPEQVALIDTTAEPASFARMDEKHAESKSPRTDYAKETARVERAANIAELAEIFGNLARRGIDLPTPAKTRIKSSALAHMLAGIQDATGRLTFANLSPSDVAAFLQKRTLPEHWGIRDKVYSEVYRIYDAVRILNDDTSSVEAIMAQLLILQNIGGFQFKRSEGPPTHPRDVRIRIQKVLSASTSIKQFEKMEDEIPGIFGLRQKIRNEIIRRTNWRTRLTKLFT